MAFLDLVAQDIRQKRDKWGKFALVFPNARTINYFKRHYARLIDKPEKLYIFPWQRFLQSALGLESAGNIELVFVLYQAFRDVLGQKEIFAKLSFDEFFHLGQTILSDFNEVDNYLIDPRQIFVNLSDLERLSDKEFLTQEQREAISHFWKHYRGKDDLKFFLELFSNLTAIYERFHSRLLSLGRVYGGMRNRLIVSELRKGEDLFSQWDTVAFIGFYALSESELEIMNFIKKEHQAHFYWDYDDFYMKDREHEAGFFLHKNIQLLGEEEIGNHDNLLRNKRIDVVSVPQNVAQTKILPWAFEQMGIQDDMQKIKNTAIVLLEESLLFPVLYSLPEQVGDVNITLQFPFYLSSLYSFLDKWLFVIGQLLRNGQIYYKDFQILMSSEVMQKFFASFVEEFSQTYRHDKRLLVTFDFVKGMADADILFGLEKKDGMGLISLALKLVYRVYKNADDFEREYIYNIHSHLQSLKKQLHELKVDFSAQTMISLLRQIFYSIRVPFEGQKLDALQIITIMETRNLDFENVIILSANEGIYPPIKRSQSFFPEFIRAAYHLPILRYQDSLYSYFFYRLLQRASHVMLVYNSITDSGVGGKSRYILQLEKETSLITGHHVFTDTLSLPQEDKDEEMTGLPEPMKALSVSAINTYIACPRQFFYRYIARLEAPEDENILEINEADFGSVVHRSLELLYNDLSQRTDNHITEQDLVAAKKEVEQYLDRAVEETELRYFYNKGFFTIIRRSMQEYVLNALEYDRGYAPFSIVSLERSAGKYRINFDLGDNKSVQLYGIIDRIDRKDNVIRVIDYKTGQKYTSVSNMDKLFAHDHNKEVFQLLFYKLLVKDLFDDASVVPVLYSLPLLRDKSYSGFIRINRLDIMPETLEVLDNQLMPEFEEKLRALVKKILFEDRTFSPTPSDEACKYCPYAELCGL